MAKSKVYKGVYIKTKSGIGRMVDKWYAQHTYIGSTWVKYCDTEIEAAKAYDMRLIKLGLEPINILKRVQNYNNGTR